MFTANSNNVRSPFTLPLEASNFFLQYYTWSIIQVMRIKEIIPNQMVLILNQILPTS